MDAYESELLDERVRNARRAAMMRVAIVGTFLVNLVVLVAILRGEPFAAGPVVFTGYFLLAVLANAVTRRSDRTAVLSWYFIPFFDMPVLLVVQFAMLSLRGLQPLVPSFLFLAALYLLLILFSVLSLRPRVVVLSSIMAIVLTQLFAIRTGIPGYYWSVLTILLIASFTSAALYALYRLHALLRATVEEQARIDRLKRYFSPQVAAVLEESEAGVEDSVTRTITVLFGDIRGFTAITLNEPPGRILELLNEYHAVMVDRIFDSGGTLDKFIGDGVMAYFNAPLEQPDHAERAIRCATAMMEGLAELNGRRAARGEAALRMGIGIHTGPATLGSIGPEVRREYTAIGETVNLAAHVEQLTRETGGGILLTESTRRGLENRYPIEPRPDLRLGDGERPLSLYRLLMPGVAS